MIVNTANISSIDHSGTTLTIVFLNGGRRYKYWPVTTAEFDILVENATKETNQDFKDQIKDIKTRNYEEIKD